MEFASGIEDFIRDTEAFSGGSWTDASIAEQRVAYERYAGELGPPRRRGVVGRDDIVDWLALAVPVRVYEPDNLRTAGAVVYFHGGGFVVGSLDSHDSLCAEIAAGAGCRVLSVGYRLAPEFPFPAALDDGLAVLEFLRASPGAFGIDPGRLVVAGDSAGGNLAAGLALRYRDAGGMPLAGQILFYPVLGFEPSLPSHEENARAPLLTTDDVTYYMDTYCPDGHPGPWGAPLSAGDFTGLPPALIAVAEYDPLRDEGVIYHGNLITAGVPSELYLGEGLVHGGLRAVHRSEAARAFLDAGIAAARRMIDGD